MALKGNLSTVSLADIFQVLSHGHSTGLLRIQAPEGTRFVEILDGQVSIVARSSNRILLGDLLLSRGLVDEDTLNKALAVQKQSGKLLGQLLMDIGALQLVDIENALRFQIEEEICDLFLLKSAEFDFLANATLDAKMALGGGLVRLKIDPNGLLLEAARRLDDWQKVEKRVSSQSMLFELTNQGAELLKSAEGLSAEGMILLKLIEEGRTIESMVQKACLGRLNTNMLLTELWDAQLVVPAQPERYVQAAETHLQHGRLEEADRIAAQALRTEGDKGRKEALSKVQSEAERKKKMTSSVTLESAARVRSEVIRRPNPSLILKQHRSPLPFILGGVAVLALVAVGLWFFLVRGKGPSVDLDEQRQFDAWVQQVETATHAGEYKQAQELLKHAYSTQALREKANDQAEKFKRHLESKLTPLLNEAEKALAANEAEKIAKLEGEIRGLHELQIIGGALNENLLSTLKKIAAWHGRMELARCQERLKAIDGLESMAEQQAGLEKLGKEVPGEVVHARVREALARLVIRHENALTAFTRAQQLDAAGDITGAKIEYEAVRRYFSGGSEAQTAAVRLQALAEKAKQVEQQLGQLERWAMQKKTDEARDGLIKFLQDKPEPLFADRARSILRTLVPPDAEVGAENGLRDAEMLDARNQAAEARKKRLEVLDKFPHTMAAAKTTLQIKVVTEPRGCQLNLNGRDLKDTTPATIELPAVGPLRLRIRKKGFEDAEFIARDFRGEKIDARLMRERSRSIPLCLLPAVPDSLSVRLPYAGMSAGGELLVWDTARKDSSELLRQRLAETGGEPGKAGAPFGLLLAAIRPETMELFVPGPGKQVRAFKLPGLTPRIFELGSPAASPAILFAEKDAPGRLYLAVSTEAGLEQFAVADAARRGEPRVCGAGEVPRMLGLAWSGTHIFLPRPDGNLYAVRAKDGQGWTLPLPPSPLAPPACHAGSDSVAVLGAAGKLSVYEAGSEKKIYDRDLGATYAVGLLAAGKGYLAISESGRADLLAPESPKSLWTANLGAGAVVLPVAAGANAVAVALPGEVVVLNVENGEVLWRAKLFATPVALAVDAKTVFVATKDSRLQAFDLDE